MLYNVVFTSLPVIALGGKLLGVILLSSGDIHFPSKLLTKTSMPRLLWRFPNCTSGESVD